MNEGSQEKTDPPAIRDANEPLSQDVRILVVDDEATIRGVIGDLLRDEGHDVAEAESGEAALEAFRRNPFPLVLTDIVMGKMTGVDLLQEIKLLCPSTEVIIMTSHASMDSSIQALKAGAYDYLIKPFDELGQILNVVNRAIEKLDLTRRNQNLMEILQEHSRELEQASRVLREQAARDGLTGLYNHRQFQESLHMELARSQRAEHPLSLIMIDIDHFKNFNDTHGHPAGDKLLRELAAILEDSVRVPDFVARYGGEEFVMLLPGLSKEGALQLADRVRHRVTTCPFEGGEMQPGGCVTISVGVATSPEDAEEAELLVEKADQALYRAKAGGRNTVVAS